MEESLADKDIFRNWNTLSEVEKGRRNHQAGLACLIQEAEVRGSQEAKGSNGGGKGASPVQLHLLHQHFLTDDLDVLFQLQDAGHMVSLLSAQDVPLFCELPVGPGKPLELRFPKKRKAETHLAMSGLKA